MANIVGKALSARGRPGFVVSEARQVPQPRSTSFPSGHAASAAAFATGVSLEMPSLAVPMIGLASAVAASRVATGVHYPSDVLAGTVIGGAAGVLTLRWRPGTTTPSLVRRLRAELPQATVIESGPGQDLGTQLRLAAAQAWILGWPAAMARSAPHRRSHWIAGCPCW
jgi:undecaprenyl-diphosphatase